ncbi:hypothetical protein PV325_011288 [Microctonus aethiopoides]|uniref:Uncharacterized protein n=1 Tax=Microctonus aethiopoides TaxID=144406 RepID=A0AA39FYL5_9HYME|nr:hypothetical protein PV325_011288 [Microctonus aethiopoides]KAK0178244.1 hypothetical protein PV328_002215 [Microctonus aethiopoides]
MMFFQPILHRVHNHHHHHHHHHHDRCYSPMKSIQVRSYGCLPGLPCECPALPPMLAVAGCVWWVCAEFPAAGTGAGAAGHLGGKGEITEAATAAAC